MNISKKFVFGKFQLLQIKTAKFEKVHDTMYREGTGMVAMQSRKTRRSRGDRFQTTLSITFLIGYN